MWLGLLFSVLAITMRSYHMLDEEPPEYEGISEALLSLYRLRTAQCLMIGDIAKCLPHTLETLIHYASAEHARKEDNYRGQWMLASFIVRAAVNMGYHREPSQTSSISVLQAEYRRRVWSSIASIDQKASFLLGFPTMIAAIPFDVREPRNLYDWELFEKATVLPPSRPLVECTPVTHLIVKWRLIRTLGEITDFNNALKSGSYDNLLKLDQALHQAYKEIPPPDPSESMSASTATTWQMDFLYHQGVCFLHRKYLSKGRTDLKYSHSRDQCISSALSLLDQQHSLHKKPVPNAANSMPYWYRGRHPFILAAMIVCLDLEQGRKGSYSDVPSNQADLLKALSRCCTIWKESQGFSVEADGVYNFLASILQSFETPLEPVRTTSPCVQPIEPIKTIQKPEDTAFEASNEMDIDWVCNPLSCIVCIKLTLI
jgi:hypothetical protein